MITGTAHVADEPTRIVVCRFLPDGTPSPMFGAPETPGCRMLAYRASYHSALAASDTSLFVVRFVSIDLEPTVLRLAADSGEPQPFGDQETVPLLPPGVIDPGTSDGAIAWDLDLMPDGDLIAVGYTVIDGRQEAFVARFDPVAGLPRAGFGVDGYTRTDFGDAEGIRRARAVEVQADGSLLVTSYLRIEARSFIGVARLDGNSGQPDPGFNGGTPLAYDPCPLAVFGCTLTPSRSPARRPGRSSSVARRKRT